MVDDPNGIRLGLGHPDFLQRALPWCEDFGILFQDVRRLVTQLRCSGCLATPRRALPEAERAAATAICDARCQTATLQIGAEITPRSSLAHATVKPTSSFCLRACPDDHRDATEPVPRARAPNG